MALVQETVTLNATQFLHTFSDDGHYIIQTDTERQYVEAYDPYDPSNPSGNLLGHSYVEDDELIPDPDVDPEADPFAEAGRILLGVGDDE